MAEQEALPRRTRVYQSHVLDSSRWDRFAPRPDDIVVATAYKAGTTWMQTIVANLIFQGEDIPGPVMELAPWIDMRPPDLEELLERIEGQGHRRFLKTHLALDGLRYFPEIRYIYVGRDLRDVFMSIWNHHRNYAEPAVERFREIGREIGRPWPDCPDDPKEFWRDWMTRSIFPWEREGYPYWSMLHHLDSWWRYRHLPNILFVHYNDLLSDPRGEVARVAAYLEIEVPESAWSAILDAISMRTMRNNVDKIMGVHQEKWVGGGKTFINKGTNKRWLGVLNEEDLALYRSAVERNLEPAAATWLEQGGRIA